MEREIGAERRHVDEDGIRGQQQARLEGLEENVTAPRAGRAAAADGHVPPWMLGVEQRREGHGRLLDDGIK